jgi:hypothetical protein
MSREISGVWAYTALLQTRTRALDGTLRPLFERWYSGLAADSADEPERAAA